MTVQIHQCWHYVPVPRTQGGRARSAMRSLLSRNGDFFILRVTFRERAELWSKEEDDPWLSLLLGSFMPPQRPRS